MEKSFVLRVEIFVHKDTPMPHPISSSILALRIGELF